MPILYQDGVKVNTGSELTSATKVSFNNASSGMSANNTQSAIDELSTDIKDSLYISADSKNLKFGKDGDGNYGYYKGDGTFSPFKSGFSDLLYVAPEYDTSVAYMVDDIVLNENVLYRCTATTTGTFDSAKWERIYLTDIAQEEVVQSNENLLDNAWFNVNSRGQTSYTSGYTVDRWKIQYGTPTVTVGSNYLTVNGSNMQMRQWLSIDYDELKSKNVTLTIVNSDGNYKSVSAICPSTKPTSSNVIAQTKLDGFDINLSYRIPEEQFALIIGVGSTQSSISIKAVKLELGDKSTLYLDSAPDVKWETVKCQLSTADANDTYANKVVGNNKVGQITDLTTSWKDVNLGFTPKYLVLSTYHSTHLEISFYANIETGVCDVYMKNTAVVQKVSDWTSMFQVTTNGFKIVQPDSNWSATVGYVAIG